jgi:hypothetical protein
MLWLALALALAGAANAQGLLVGAQGDDGKTYIRMIPVNHLNLAALCDALGGTMINLYGTVNLNQGGQPGSRFNMPGMPQSGYSGGAPSPLGGGGAIGTPGSAPRGGSLNPNAPLVPFIPTGVTNITGLQN